MLFLHSQFLLCQHFLVQLLRLLAGLQRLEFHNLVEVGWFVFDLRPDGRVSEELEVEVVLVVPSVGRPVLSLAQPQLLVVPRLAWMT